MHGHSVSPTDSGVWGENTGAGYGVSGSTNSGAAAGVWGDNPGTGPGVRGTSAGGNGVIGVSSSKTHAGVRAINDSGGGSSKRRSASGQVVYRQDTLKAILRSVIELKLVEAWTAN